MTVARVACSLMLLAEGSPNANEDLRWMSRYRRQLLCQMAEKAAAEAAVPPEEEYEQDWELCGTR